MSSLFRRQFVLRERYAFHYQMQEGLCFYCRKPMVFPYPGPRPATPDSLTREHLISRPEHRRAKNKIKRHPAYRNLHPDNRPVPPKRNAPENIVVACLACNNERGGHTPWLTFLLRKIEERWAPK